MQTLHTSICAVRSEANSQGHVSVETDAALCEVFQGVIITGYGFAYVLSSECLPYQTPYCAAAVPHKRCPIQFGNTYDYYAIFAPSFSPRRISASEIESEPSVTNMLMSSPGRVYILALSATPSTYSVAMVSSTTSCI